MMNKNVTSHQRDGVDQVSKHSELSATFTPRGTIHGMVWTRPGQAPVDMVFRQDEHEGIAWHVCDGGQWQRLVLMRVRKDAHEFAATLHGVVYSLMYQTKGDCLEVVASIRNDSGKPFSPERVFLNLGIDAEMVSHPSWNQRFSPTLLRCENTHFWGYFMRPDGIILGIASPDPVVSWANVYKPGMHRIFTSCVDLFNTDPQPARHPKVNGTVAPGEVRQWRIILAPMDTLEQVQPTLAQIAGVPMISLDRSAVQAGQTAKGCVISPKPVASFSIQRPDGTCIPCELQNGNFAFTPAQVGVYTLTLKSADGKVTEAKVACRESWSWYIQQARANAVSKPQKASSHTENWYGLFSGYIARRYFPDAGLDKAIDDKFTEIAPLMYDLKTMLPSRYESRIQNHACWASVLVDRYQVDGDIRNLEFAAAMADFLISTQTPDGAYRNGGTHYTCVVYIAKSIMEVMAEEKKLTSNPVWKERYDRHYASVRRAVDDLAHSLDNIETEGEMTYEDGMIACSYTQLAMFALLQDNPADREKYLAAAKTLASGHRCLSQILIPDCRMNGGSLRYWESQYDILTAGVNMMNSPHGWSAWRLYGLWYLYLLTGEREYLRQAMNGLASCAQLIDFATGDLRWAFVPDPCVRTQLFEPAPPESPVPPEFTPIGNGYRGPRIVGEQYLPMISGWYRAKPNTWVLGYLFMRTHCEGEWLGGCCDNDVHEIFKCMGEIALDSAYVLENLDGSLETWNCTAHRDATGSIIVNPSEAVVSRVHFNLAKPATVTVDFASGRSTGSVQSMGWFGPGGVPEELR